MDVDFDSFDEGDSPADTIVRRARRRFKKCQDWEMESRDKALSDLKFANADPDNGWQWPDDKRRNRDLERRPALTINKVRIHCKQITNDARQNKPSVTIRPTGNGATYESAQVYEGIVRHIEYISRAESAYMTASDFQVKCGIGYWRIVTDYADAESFDQEVYIRRIKDPSVVYLDPDIDEEDGSDARFGFIFSDVPRDEFRSEYPEWKDKISSSMTSLGDDGWITPEHIRVCEYYEKTQIKDKLLRITDPDSGEVTTILASKLPSNIKKEALADKINNKSRDVLTDNVRWYKIAGQEIIDEADWAGKFIPIVRVVGEETIIEKQLDRKGHVRNMKDAQRMYNWMTSAATEAVSLQGKTPWLVDVESVEELESYWARANTENFAYLPYRSSSTEGHRPLAPPQRQDPAQYTPAYMTGMQVAQQEMMMATGQYQAQLGEQENAKSGVAISERQRQGDNATYHFIDGLANGIRFTGKILVDLIPKIYDTNRIVRILGEDGTESEIEIDPMAKQAYLQKQKTNTDEIQAIFNPNVGTYAVEADVGPAYATRRQETYNACVQILTSNKELTPIIGDLMMESADFPLADKMAERMKRMVPPQALGEAPPEQFQQAMQAAQQQIGQLHNTLTHMVEEMAKDKIALKAKDQMRDIDAFDAETKRITAVSNSIPEIGDTPDMKALVLQTIHEMMSSNLKPVYAASAPGLDMEALDDGQQQAPIPGAKRSPVDGNYYIQHPTTGQHFKVDVE